MICFYIINVQRKPQGGDTDIDNGTFLKNETFGGEIIKCSTEFSIKWIYISNTMVPPCGLNACWTNEIVLLVCRVSILWLIHPLLFHRGPWLIVGTLSAIYSLSRHTQISGNLLSKSMELSVKITNGLFTFSYPQIILHYHHLELKVYELNSKPPPLLFLNCNIHIREFLGGGGDDSR